MSVFNNLLLFEEFAEWFWKIIIGIAAIFFKVVGFTYEIFNAIASSNLQESTNIDSIFNKLYILVGIIVLFVIAYNVLLMIIDPDKNKGGKIAEDLIKKVITSFIMIVLVPTAFTIAMDVQNAVIKSSILTDIFSETASSTKIENAGFELADSLFYRFFSTTNTGDYNKSEMDNLEVCANKNSCNLESASSYARETGNFTVYKAFARNIVDGDVQFEAIIALIVGGYVAYIIISFCFDVAVRVFKLMLYRLIAPFCIACRIIPKKESVYSSWFTATWKTYLSVFIRIMVLSFGVFLTTAITRPLIDGILEGKSGNAFLNMLTTVFLVVGAVSFIKAAPNLIDDIFGFKKGGDIDFSMKKKAVPLMAAAAGIGAGATGMVRNGVYGASRVANTVRNTKGSGWKKAGAGIAAGASALGSTFAGGFTGAYHGYKTGAKASEASWKGIVDAAGKGGAKVVENREKREAYGAQQNLGAFSGNTPIIGSVVRGVGHVTDAAHEAVRWTGIDNVSNLQRQNQKLSKINSALDAVKDSAKDLFIGDAGKGKNKTYGLTGTYAYAGKDAAIKAATSAIRPLNFDTQIYRDLSQQIADAKTAGNNTLTWEGATLSISQWEAFANDYATEASKLIANQAAVNINNYDDWAKSVGQDVAMDLSKVRTKATEASIAIQQNADVISDINREIAAANARDGKSRATYTTDMIRGKADMKFDGDSAIASTGDAVKIISGRNENTIISKKKEEKK